jgi:hypothetical protein
MEFIYLLQPLFILAMGILLLKFPLQIMRMLGSFYRKRAKYFPLYKEAWFDPSPRSAIIARILGVILTLLALDAIASAFRGLFR